MFDIIKSLSKQQQFEFFQAIRGKIGLSQSEIARAANVSHGLVSAVFNGINQNPKVIEIIELNIEDGWAEIIKSKIKSDNEKGQLSDFEFKAQSLLLSKHLKALAS